MAASRARRMRNQPLINTIHMKPMVTLWEKPDPVAVGEIR